MKILIIGNGFIGARCAKTWGGEATVAEGHVSTVADVLALLDAHKPDVVLNAAGVVGKPNVDWCETHQSETIFGNTVLPIMIAEACQERGTYLLHLGTGCIYYGYSSDPKGWKEDDPANPLAVYTRSKYAADLVLSTLPNVGIARLRMPIDSVPFRGNLIDKLASFKSVADVVNSATVVEDLVSVLRQLLEKRGVGIFHATNPGSVKHRDIISLYEQYVDPSHTNEWIPAEELLARGLVSKTRSNTLLQSTNLERLGIHMRPIQEAILDTIKKYATAHSNVIA